MDDEKQRVKLFAKPGHYYSPLGNQAELQSFWQSEHHARQYVRVDALLDYDAMRALYEKIARDDLSKEDCLAWVAERETQFEGMDIPAIILREICEKLLPEGGEHATTSTS